jgi:hypothetical protein
MTVHNTWRYIPSGIPSRRELREEKLRQVRADRDWLMTQESEAEPRRRIAVQVARDWGREGLFQQ